MGELNNKNNGTQKSENLLYQIEEENSNITENELNEMVEEMRNLEIGVELKERKSFFKVYTDCFIAKELVNWLVNSKNYSVQYSVEICQKLVDKSFIFCCSKNSLLFQNNGDFWKFG